MEIIIGLAALFIFITIAFLVLAFFFPEWLGITGKKAKEVMASHVGEEDTSKQETKH